MAFIVISLLLIAATYGFYRLIERNLAERHRARAYRAIFLRTAEELIVDPTLPRDKAALLVSLGSLRPGWVTRAQMLLMLKRGLVGRTSAGQGSAWLNRLPEDTHLRFAVAVIAFSLADSYHCAFLGRMYRAAMPWLDDMTQTPTNADANSAATTRVVYDVIHQAPAQMEQSQPAAVMA